MMVELWVGVTPSGRSPVIWIPMIRDPEGDETKGRGLDVHQYEARGTPNPIYPYQLLEARKGSEAGNPEKKQFTSCILFNLHNSLPQ
jgi:hypothetical protein